MTVPAIARILFFAIVAGLLASCGLAGGRPTASPAPTVSPTNPQTTAPSNSPTDQAPTTDPTQPPTTDPPVGLLRGADDSVEGWQGSYCWQSTCADAPATPPKDQLAQVAGDGGDLEFSLSDGATFHTWRATYSTGSNDESIPLGEGGQGFDPDARPSAEPELLSAAMFASPPIGDWVVFVQVFFDGGDLSYAWRVVVS